MSIFPKIQGACPYKSELSKYMEGDLCRMCDRRVVDLNPLSNSERVDLISGCKDKICVSYTLRPAAAAVLAVIAIAVPMSVAAQDFAVEEEAILVGAIIDPNAIEYISDDEADATPQMPIVYDDETSAEAPDGDASIPTNQTSKPRTTNE